METFEYFPTQIRRDERPDFLDNIASIAVEAIDEVRNVGATMSQSNCLLGNDQLEGFKNYLLLASTEMLRQQGYDLGRYDFYMSGLWAQDMKKPACTTPHVHKNSQISGWFFTKVPENGAYVVYHDPRSGKNMVDLDIAAGTEITNATGSVYFNNLKDGTVLFNNSWINHQLISGTSEDPTRCFHFIISHREHLLCNMP